MAFFPMFIELREKQVLVVGAGRIGGRRIGVLTDFGADVTVVEKAPSPEIRRLAQERRIHLVCEDYRAFRETDKQSFFMVLAATGDREIDNLAAEDAAGMKAYFNMAGEKEQSDFYFPGIAAGKVLTAGIIAGGENHGLARRAAGQMKKLIDEMEAQEYAGEQNE